MPTPGQTEYYQTITSGSIYVKKVDKLVYSEISGYGFWLPTGIAAESGVSTNAPSLLMGIASNSDGNRNGGYFCLNTGTIQIGPYLQLNSVFPSTTSTTAYGNCLANITGNLYWNSGNIWMQMTSGGSLVAADEKVKADSADPTAG